FPDLELPAKLRKEGSLAWEGLTLLSVDEQQLPVSLRMRRMTLCEHAPSVGEPVVVVVPEEPARSYIMAPLASANAYRSRFSTVIRDVATTGNSGSGVFDATRKCLMGIMSRKFQVRSMGSDGEMVPRDIAKYFVPASTIRDFIPAEYRFAVAAQ